MPTRPHRAASWSVALATLALLVAGCSSDGGSDPERTGPTDQAVERLHDFGLTKDQAACIVDEVGADAVVEATDLSALTDSQQYQDAAEACLDEE
jgi:hypothetical protein